MVDIILREIKKARNENHLKRNVQLSSLAYLETIAPPSRPLPDDFDYNNFSITFFPIDGLFPALRFRIKSRSTCTPGKAGEP